MNILKIVAELTFQSDLSFVFQLVPVTPPSMRRGFSHFSSGRAFSSSAHALSAGAAASAKLFRVRICKGFWPTLGIAIEGGSNVSGQPLPRIIAIQPEGAAYAESAEAEEESGGDGSGKRRLRVGQLIKEVDGIQVAGKHSS